jgi:REP element-mobilizing transposase RayT
MASRRWIVSTKDPGAKPVFYHCISRVVDKRLAFGPAEKEKFRTFMRMQENFTGCRVVSYCLMSNHVHLLVEAPPMPRGGLTDDELLERLRAIYNGGFVAEVAAELADARQKVRDGLGKETLIVRIHERFTYRMHDLSQFMKTLMQRFTKWFNRTHERRGNLWEDVFKSVIVEDGVAAKTISAYIDLNPVRAGIAKDPAEYRWSSYGEAIGGGPGGNGKKARAGLVRALRAHKVAEADASLWANEVAREYRKILITGAKEKLEVRVGRTGESVTRVTRKGMHAADAQAEAGLEGEIPFARILQYRIRYFSAGAVIGSRGFVNGLFANSRERFGSKRKDGARKLRGGAAPAAGSLWSLRDLRTGID